MHASRAAVGLRHHKPVVLVTGRTQTDLHGRIVARSSETAEKLSGIGRPNSLHGPFSCSKRGLEVRSFGTLGFDRQVKPMRLHSEAICLPITAWMKTKSLSESSLTTGRPRTGQSFCMIRAQISKLCKICSERYFPFFRLEKATAKLPKKDLAAVKKRFAFLEVRM